MKIFSLTLITILAFAAAANATTFTIGGFDSSRGGVFSLEAGSDMSDLRTDLTSTFSNVAFTESSTLTTAYLSTINILLICAPAGSTTPITSLSSSEQSALLSFVDSGGSALIFCDNNDQFSAASNSMASVFGMDTTGDLNGKVTATVTDSNSPITNGPFGSVSTFTTAYPGWFDSLGSNATALADLPNSEPVLAEIDRGVLSPGSGQVILFGDADVIINTSFSGSNIPLINNAVASAVPEPTSCLSLISGLICILGFFGFNVKR